MTGATRSPKDRLFTASARILLAILFIAGLSGALLQAGDKRGATVSVKLTDGTLAYGELVRVEPTRLVLSAERGRTKRTVAIEAIATIQVFRERRFEPRLLNGAALGVFAGLLASSSNRDYHDDYAPTLAPSLLGVAGLLAGLGLEAAGKRSETISLEGLSSTLRSSLLNDLEADSRDHRAGHRDWLGGFRLSLRPYFHPPLPIRLDGAASLPAPYGSTATEATHRKDQSYPNRLGRVRVDYGLRPWLFLGFEFASLGGHQVGAVDYPSVVRDGQTCVSGLFTSGTVEATAAVLGVSLGAASGPRVELGAGLAFSSLREFGPIEGSPWIGDAPRSFRLKASPVFQLGASWEFSPGDAISGGVFAGYMVLRPMLPATTFNGGLSFYPGTELGTDRPVAFRLDSELTFPAQHVGLSGFNFGVFIRIK